MVVVLLWVGGTVTTYDAGMAVEDWPTTYGYWFYPPARWLGGVWDLFLEHGHRLLAQAVGIMAIVLVGMVFYQEQRRSVRWLASGVLAAVVFQGILGGLRVWFDQSLLAMIHGCFAPVFLCLCGALVTISSSAWIEASASRHVAQLRRIRLAGRAMVVFCYLEIFLGAQLRHPDMQGWPRWFELLVWVKLIGAGLIVLGAGWLAVAALRSPDRQRLLRPVLLLVGAVGLQLILAAAVWLTNYGCPAWFRRWFFTPALTVVRESPLQVLVTTGHATLGALCLLAAVSVALWSGRLLRGPMR